MGDIDLEGFEGDFGDIDWENAEFYYEEYDEEDEDGDDQE